MRDLRLVRLVLGKLCLLDLEMPSDDDGYAQPCESERNDLGEILMWSSRSRIREEDERHKERTTDRLRRLGASSNVGRDADPEQVRARLERMTYGAPRQSRPNEIPA